MPVINNVTFLYTKIQSPVVAYNKVDTEFSVDVVMSKADAKALGKEFPKQKAKQYDNDEFTEKFKIDPPFLDQDEQFVAKFKKSHTKGDNVTPEKYYPRVFVPENGQNVDKTYEILVGNGSKGKLSYRVKETTSYGNFVELQSILVEDLVVYESKSGGVGADFGVGAVAEVPSDLTVVKKQGEKPTAKAAKASAKKAPEPQDEDGSEDAPF